MAEPSVTLGAINRLVNDTGVNPQNFQPVLEVRGYSQVKSKKEDGNDRVMVMMADGVHTFKAVVWNNCALGVQFKNGSPPILPGALIRVNDYEVVHAKNNKKCLGVRQADVVGQQIPVPDHMLRKYVNPFTGDDFSATQAIPATQGEAAYATPERRGSPMAEQTPTPRPAVPAFRADVPPKRPDEIAEAETQPDGPPVQNPYAQNPYAQADAPSSGYRQPEMAAFSAPAAAVNPLPADAPTSGYRQPEIAAPPSGYRQPEMAAFRAPAAAVNPLPAAPGPESTASANPYSTALPYQPPAPAASFRAGGGGRNSMPPSSGGIITPVATLSPYTGGRWKIKARVLTKGDVRRFTNSRGEGQLMKVDLADQSGEISATFFGKAVDKYNAILQAGQVYTFQKGQIKPANKRYEQGDYALVFEEHSLIEAVDEDQAIPGVTYSFQPLSDIANLPPETLVDVKAVIYSVQDPFTFTAKTSQKEMTKRSIGIWDPSGPDGTTQELTVWGERALGDDFQVGTVVFLKRARVSEFNGEKNLSSPAQMDLSPDHGDAVVLMRQYQEQQARNPLSPVRRATTGGSRQTLQECRSEDMKLGPPLVPGQQLDPNGPRSVHRHSCIVTLATMPTDRGPYYPSCPASVEFTPRSSSGSTQPPATQTRACNKKSQMEDGVWRCQAGHTCERPVFRYLYRMNALDHSDSLEVNVYDDVAKTFFGCSADDYVPIFEGGQEGGEREPELKNLNRKIEWKKVCLRLRAQKEVWQETERIRYSVDEANAAVFAKEARQLLAEVHSSLAAM